MTDEIKNKSASVRQRLINRAHAEGQDAQRLFVRYAIERLLFRLSQSPQRDRFILKGAMLFALWSKQPFRSTGDLDLLGFGDNDIASLRETFESFCYLPVADDGLSFDPKSVQVEATREEDEYQGARVRLNAMLGTAIIALQIDIGFGDSVFPEPQNLSYPCLLEGTEPAQIRAYPLETVIAEKFEAMVSYGNLTSRLKDHYDIWVLSQNFEFSKEPLLTAVTRTFEQRGTTIPDVVPVALTEEFALRSDKQANWVGFLRRTKPSVMPPPFDEVLKELRRFLAPFIAGATIKGLKWSSKDGWI
jgi:hypothetical protein